MKVALQEPMGVIINSSYAVVRGQSGRRVVDGVVGCEKAGVHILNRQGGKRGNGVVLSVEAATCFVISDFESGRGVVACDDSSAEIGEHAEILDDGHAEDGVNSHIIAETERDADRATIIVKVGGLVSNDCGKLTM